MAFLGERASTGEWAGAADPEAVRRVPRAIAFGYDVLGLGADENSLRVAVPDLDDREPIERLRYATGLQVDAVSAPRDLIRRRLNEAYGASSSSFDPAEDPPVVRLWDALLRGALDAHASDLHVEPLPHGGRVRQRIDGVLRETASVPAELFERLVARVKLLAGMDIADRRRPQDGSIAAVAQACGVDVRVSSMPTICGERLVVRFFEREGRTPNLDALGMDEPTLRRYRAALRGTHGCILACGPTGSGKTTTLYASLRDRDDGARQLCSIEDPVEVSLPGVTQIQVNPRAGLTFAAALRGIVRQDPDVVMIGEIRDEETARAAIAASLAGHLVLASVHANDALGAVDRLVELGVERAAVAAALRAVVAQRLVRLRGGGRTGAFELAVVDDAVRDALATRAARGDIDRLLRERGFRSMREASDDLDARELLARAEIERVFGASLA